VNDSAIALRFFPQAVLDFDAIIENGTNNGLYNGTTNAIYTQTPGQELQLRTSMPIGDLANATLRCRYRQAVGQARQGTPLLNVSYETLAQDVSGSTLVCPVPFLEDHGEELSQFWVSLATENAYQTDYVDHSFPLRVWLKQRPVINSVHPAVIPAGDSAAYDFRIFLQGPEHIEPDLHAIRVGNSGDLRPILTATNGSMYFEAPEKEAGFQRLSIYLPQEWALAARFLNNSLYWETNLALEYMELPKPHGLIPETLPAGSPANTTARATHLLSVAGQNFTNDTECVIDGVVTVSRWLAQNLLECHVPAIHRAGETSILQLKQRGLYLSRGAGLTITYVAQPYVYLVEPSIILTGRVASLITIHMVDMEAYDNSTAGTKQVSSYYCKFTSATRSRAVKAAVVATLNDYSEDRLGTHVRAALPPVARREIRCRSPLESAAVTVQVEVLTPRGTTFSAGSLNSTL